MKAEIVAVGTELLLGQIVDTNSAHIARQLTTVGLDVHFKSTVGDNMDRVKATLGTALSRADFVITTGGIGPTLDDLTRDAVAEITGRPLTFQPHLFAQIENFFARLGRPVGQNNRRQAFIPEGAIPIENPVGTAPGFILEQEIGLGDVVKRATSSIGIRPCGGCEGRAAVLNRWFVFSGRRWE